MGIWRVPNGRVVPRRPLGFFNSNTSLCRKCVWSGETFKCELLWGQGNANARLTACHRHWIFPQHPCPVFLLFGGWRGADCQQAPYPLYREDVFPASLLLLSSLSCISIPGPSRIYSPMICICICWLSCFTGLLFLLHASVSHLPKTSKCLEDQISLDTEKLARGHSFDLVSSSI